MVSKNEVARSIHLDSVIGKSKALFHIVLRKISPALLTATFKTHILTPIYTHVQCTSFPYAVLFPIL